MTDLEAKVRGALEKVFDPELHINIVDLGLVYDVLLEGDRVDVKLTLTAPGCHLGGQIAADVQAKNQNCRKFSYSQTLKK